MKTKYLFWLIVLFGVVVEGLLGIYFVSNSKADISVKTYSSNNLSFKYPSNWSIEKTASSKTGQSVRLNNGSGEILVEIRRISMEYQTYSSAQIADSQAATFLANNSGWQKVAADETDVSSNIKSGEVMLDSGEREAKLVGGQTKSWMYSLLLISGKNDFDLLQFDMDEIANGLSIR